MIQKIIFYNWVPAISSKNFVIYIKISNIICNKAKCKNFDKTIFLSKIAKVINYVAVFIPTINYLWLSSNFSNHRKSVFLRLISCMKPIS